MKSTAQRLYPNYANIDWSGNAGYDKNNPETYFSTMGCRTANGADINALPGQNPQQKDGRGNICPVTIILPTLAMKAKEYVLEFGQSAVGTEHIILGMLKEQTCIASKILQSVGVTEELFCSAVEDMSVKNYKDDYASVGFTPKAKEVIEKHIKGGSVIGEYTVSTTNIAK